MLSFICFWPYTRSFNVDWKLLLKFISCCWPKGRLGFEFQPYWGWNSELLELLLVPTKFPTLPECPVSPHVSHVIRDSETWLTSWCGDSSFFIRSSNLATNMSTVSIWCTPLGRAGCLSPFQLWLEAILSISAFAPATSRERKEPPAAASTWSWACWFRPWKKFWMISHSSIPWCGHAWMYSWRHS